MDSLKRANYVWQFLFYAPHELRCNHIASEPIDVDAFQDLNDASDCDLACCRIVGNSRTIVGLVNANTVEPLCQIVSREAAAACSPWRKPGVSPTNRESKAPQERHEISLSGSRYDAS